MDKHTQDLNWRCLPKETRAQMRLDYPSEDDSEWDRGYASALRQFFGNRNLKSNTEPEEMLMVEKREVQRVYAEFPLRNTIAPDQAVKLSLNILFGDKCLPDPTVLNIPSGGGGMSLTPPAYKLDVETDNELEQRLEQASVQVETYTDPENPNMVKSSQLNKDNMEEKELNLAELLKGCEGEEFYSLIHGTIKLLKIDSVPFPLYFKVKDREACYAKNGHYDKVYEIDAPIVLYPSRVLYEKYPLDAKKAWNEWASERKLKYNVKVIIECWKDNDDNLHRMTFGVTYSSKEEAEQASKAVRETLMKFHEKFSAKNLDNPK